MNQLTSIALMLSSKSSIINDNLFVKLLSHVIKPRSILAFVILYLLIKYRDNSIGSRRANILGPKGLPLVGNTMLLASTPTEKLLDLFHRLHEKYGGFYTITSLGVGRVIAVNDPPLLDHVARTNFWAYEKGSGSRISFAELLGDSLPSVDGHDWSAKRKFFVDIFRAKDANDFVGSVFAGQSILIANYLDKFAESGATIDIFEIMKKFTFDTLGLICLGESFDTLNSSSKSAAFVEAYERLSALTIQRLVNGKWTLLEILRGTNKQAARDKQVVDDYVYSTVQRRRETVCEPPKNDLLQKLIDFRDENGNPLPEDELRDIIMVFILGARDTTAEALSWMFYLLHCSSSDPNIIRTLEAEIDDLETETPTVETCKKMKYTKACFHEALRLYPSLPLAMKTCVKDDILPNGAEIKKGDFVFWSAYVMGRDKRIWGDDSQEFRPQRWLNKMFSPPPSKYPSFNIGPRICPGQHFATLEALTLIGILLRRFKFELVDPHNEPRRGVSFSLPLENGLPAWVYRRDTMAAEQTVKSLKFGALMDNKN